MRTQEKSRLMGSGLLLGVVALAMLTVLMPHVFAQGVQYTPADDPHGPLQYTGWAAGMAVVGVMAGIGVWTAVRRH